MTSTLDSKTSFSVVPAGSFQSGEQSTCVELDSSTSSSKNGRVSSDNCGNNATAHPPVCIDKEAEKLAKQGLKYFKNAGKEALNFFSSVLNFKKKCLELNYDFDGWQKENFPSHKAEFRRGLEVAALLEKFDETEQEKIFDRGMSLSALNQLAKIKDLEDVKSFLRSKNQPTVDDVKNYRKEIDLKQKAFEEGTWVILDTYREDKKEVGDPFLVQVTESILNEEGKRFVYSVTIPDFSTPDSFHPDLSTPKDLIFKNDTKLYSSDLNRYTLSSIDDTYNPEAKLTKESLSVLLQLFNIVSKDASSKEIAQAQEDYANFLEQGTFAAFYNYCVGLGRRVSGQGYGKAQGKIDRKGGASAVGISQRDYAELQKQVLEKGELLNKEKARRDQDIREKLELTDEKRALEEQIKELRSRNGISEIPEEFNQILQENEALKQQINNLNAKILEFSENVSSEQSASQDTANDLAALREQIRAELEEEYRQKEAQIRESERENIKKEIEASRSNLLKLQSDYTELQKKNQEIQEDALIIQQLRLRYRGAIPFLNLDLIPSEEWEKAIEAGNHIVYEKGSIKHSCKVKEITEKTYTKGVFDLVLEDVNTKEKIEMDSRSEDVSIYKLKAYDFNDEGLIKQVKNVQKNLKRANSRIKDLTDQIEQNVQAEKGLTGELVDEEALIEVRRDLLERESEIAKTEEVLESFAISITQLQNNEISLVKILSGNYKGFSGKARYTGENPTPDTQEKAVVVFDDDKGIKFLGYILGFAEGEFEVENLVSHRVSFHKPENVWLKSKDYCEVTIHYAGSDRVEKIERKFLVEEKLEQPDF
jgi:hypothetical protein